MVDTVVRVDVGGPRLSPRLGGPVVQGGPPRRRDLGPPPAPPRVARPLGEGPRPARRVVSGRARVRRRDVRRARRRAVTRRVAPGADRRGLRGRGRARRAAREEATAAVVDIRPREGPPFPVGRGDPPAPALTRRPGRPDVSVRGT